MKYTVEYFINKFQAIPESAWAVGNFIDNFGRKCAQGHCGLKSNEEAYQIIKDRSNPELNALIDLFGGLMYNKEGRLMLRIGTINNGKDPSYTQKTAKQRILAALQDLKDLQIPEKSEKVVYITVDKAVRQLQKSELNLN